MNLALRRRHQRIVVALGIILPVAFAFGIATRFGAPAVAALPAIFARDQPELSGVEWERADLFANVPMRVRLLRQRKGAGRFAFELKTKGKFTKPDLLVYWTAGNSAISGSLPANAVFLGTPGSPFLLLPEDAAAGGKLILYSLPGSEVVGVSQIITFNSASKN